MLQKMPDSALHDLPTDVIACEWGYEDTHPFAARCERLADIGIPFMVCPGTSSWNSWTHGRGHAHAGSPSDESSPERARGAGAGGRRGREMMSVDSRRGQGDHGRTGGGLRKEDMG